MPEQKTQNSLMIIAGEVSGDIHGAHLIAALRQQDADLNLNGIGGDLMIKQGFEATYHIKQMAFMGIGEVLRHLPFIRQVFRDMIRLVEESQPAAVILIDYPGFNLRFAKKIKKLGVPVIYYISPQLWAWGKKRVYKIKQFVAKMLVIFPFEKEFYGKYDIKADYVGHPLADSHYDHVHPKQTTAENNVLGLLPGSRKQELEKLLPDMIQTADRLYESQQIQKAVVLKVNTLDKHAYQKYIGERKHIEINEADPAGFYNQLDAALVSSGTATLETAYFRVPLVIVYRVSALTWFLGKRLVKLDTVGLANIVAAEKIAVELLQHEFSPEIAASEIQQLLQPPKNAEVREKLAIIREKLGKPGASERAAQIIVDFIKKRSTDYPPVADNPWTKRNIS
jgi:lipid-A-disaccharide synthase